MNPTFDDFAQRVRETARCALAGHYPCSESLLRDCDSMIEEWSDTYTAPSDQPVTVENAACWLASFLGYRAIFTLEEVDCSDKAALGARDDMRRSLTLRGLADTLGDERTAKEGQ